MQYALFDTVIRAGKTSPHAPGRPQMAIRPELGPIQVVTNGLMTASITSLVTLIPKISMLSYSYSWSGTSPAGSIAVQVSNDYSIGPTGLVVNAGTWTALYFEVAGSAASSFSVSGNTGTGFADIYQTGAYAIRTVYNFVSGTGTLQSWLHGKVS